jgi:1-acyl-sn-glycerol-3-phosphate acyltransferase
VIVLRSLLFALALVITTPPFALLGILSSPLPPHTRYRIITKWTDITLWFVWHLLGIRYRVIGRENLPEQAAVILCKHQSAWETMALQHIFPAICFVLKRELLKVPFFGWGLARMPMIAIDRAAGKDALTQVVEQGSRRLEEGFWVVVFPEGTRVAPGTTRRYKPGGAWLAHKTGAPVVPVAHNAGEFWRRNAFLKYPGEVVVSIGPVIETAGRSTEEINATAHAWIEGEMRRLFPHHYRGGAGRREQEVAEAE